MSGAAKTVVWSPAAGAVKVAHPTMLRAIATAKKKNDEVDARMIADLLRCHLLPECYMAPSEIRARRRTLRYRNLPVRRNVQMSFTTLSHTRFRDRKEAVRTPVTFGHRAGGIARHPGPLPTGRGT
jgi:hypothetical protein